MADRAPYLGTNMSAKGNPHFDICKYEDNKHYSYHE